MLRAHSHIFTVDVVAVQNGENSPSFLPRENTYEIMLKYAHLIPIMRPTDRNMHIPVVA